MALTISYDNSTLGTNGAGSSCSFTHTVGSINYGLLLVGVSYLAQSSGSVTGVTCNGTSMTLLKSQTASSARFAGIFALPFPSTGSNTIVASASATGSFIVTAVSYANCQWYNIPDSSSSSTAFSTTSITETTTTVADNSWTFMCVECNNNVSAGTGSTIRGQTNNSHAGGCFDSNGAITPPGSHSMTVTQSASSDMVAAIISFAPANPVPDARYWVGGTGTWDLSTTTHWAASSGGSGGASPPITITTSVNFDGNSGGGTTTLGYSYSGVSLNMTGYTGTLSQSSYTLSFTGNVTTGGTFTNANGLTVGGNLSTDTSSSFTNSSTVTLSGNLTTGTSSTFAGSTGISVPGNLTLATGTNWTNTGTITFTSTSSGKTITNNSVSISSPVVFNGSGGVWTLQDNLTCKSATLTAGNLVATNQTITLTGTGTVWSVGSGTFTYGTSTIKINDASSSSKTFAGGGLTYYNLYLTGAGTGAFIISGSNTFQDFKCDTPPHTIQFTAGTTQTLNTFTVNGTAGNLMTLKSTSNGSAWYLVKSPSGIVSCDYLSLQDSHVS